MKKILATILATATLLLGWASFASAAPTFSTFRTIDPETDATYNLGSASLNWYQFFGKYASTTVSSATRFCLTADTCISSWPASASTLGTISTSSALSVGGVVYATSNGYPALVSTVATGTISVSGGITATAGQSIIGSGLTIGCTTATGSVPGCLSSSDWTTFNNKVSSQWVTTGSDIYYTTGKVSVGSTTPFSSLSVQGVAGTSPFAIGSSTASYLFMDRFGNLGIASSTPGSIFSIGGILNATTATTTFYSTGGLDFASTVGICPITVAGTCLTSTINQASAFKAASNYAATTTLAGTPTYSNGTNGVGATLTEIGFGALYVDGNSPVVGDRILVKNQTSGFQNGIYTVTATGSGIASYVLTRAVDFNSPTDVFPGVSTYVIGGTSSASGGNAGEIWALTTTGAITIGTTNLTFAEGGFAGVTGGTGISVSGSTVSIDQTASLSWTGLEQFTNASTTQLTIKGPFYDGLNSPGTGGYVWMSRGAGLAPQWVATSSAGTVTSIATNNGLTGGTITISGTLGLDLTKEVSNTLQIWNGSQLAATGTPSLTAGYYIATSTSATSTLQGTVLASSGGSAGIGTSTPGNAAMLGVNGPIFVGGTAGTSTFAGGINVLTGCHAINNVCVGGGSASSATVPTITATTSVNFYYNQGGSGTMSTTTPITSGGSMLVMASCSIASPSHPTNEIWAIRVANPGGGTTTVAEIYSENSGKQASTFGVYTATTTGTARVEIDQRTNTAFDNFTAEACQDPSIVIIKF